MTEPIKDKTSGASSSDGSRNEATSPWTTLIPHVVHPAKVAVIEALGWMEEPVSSSEFVALFDSDEFYLSLVSYHIRQLVKFGVLRSVRSRQRRGAIETYYYFCDGNSCR
jgi:hypothetical protein